MRIHATATPKLPRMFDCTILLDVGREVIDEKKYASSSALVHSIGFLSVCISRSFRF